jgi:hypothetical protein
MTPINKKLEREGLCLGSVILRLRIVFHFKVLHSKTVLFSISSTALKYKIKSTLFCLKKTISSALEKAMSFSLWRAGYYTEVLR